MIGKFRGARVGVLSGGLSSEREISDRSARCVALALRGRGYTVESIPVDRRVAEALSSARIDVAFNALHGRYGEDGCIQGLLEVVGIPYTGTGVLGSAVAMDKWLSKTILERSGVPTPRGILVNEKTAPAWTGGFPVIVKPRGEGSSNGVSLVRDPAALEGALAHARAYDTDVLIEEFIPGREVTVAILDDRALAAMEVVALGDEFHTYDVKYSPGREEFRIPAPLGDLYEPVLVAALASHRVLLAESYSRVDLRVRPDGELFTLECNTLPGLHELGWYPAMARYAGIEFADLIEMLLDRASLGVRETRLEAPS